jgi:hypothetical protein
MLHPAYIVGRYCDLRFSREDFIVNGIDPRIRPGGRFKSGKFYYRSKPCVEVTANRGMNPKCNEYTALGDTLGEQRPGEMHCLFFWTCRCARAEIDRASTAAPTAGGPRWLGAIHRLVASVEVLLDGRRNSSKK